MAELTLSAVANVTFVDSSDCCCCFGIVVEDVIIIGEAVKTVEGVVTSSSLLLLRVLKIAKDILCRHDVLELHGEKANIEDFLHIYTNEMHRTNQFLILWLMLEQYCSSQTPLEVEFTQHLSKQYRKVSPGPACGPENGWLWGTC